MKKVLVVILIFLCCFLTCCSGSNNTTTYDADISVSSKSDAEDKAIAALYRMLSIHYEVVLDYTDVVVSETKYTVGSIVKNDYRYVVSGKYYLYDKYGNTVEIKPFSVEVDFDGSTKVKEY